MIFRNGGKLRRDEKWKMEGNSLEIVNYYNYLGIGLTPLCSLKKHFLDKLTISKFAIHTTYNSIISKNEVPISKQLYVYNAAVRSIICYACQVWGYQNYEEVEKLNTFFIKKLFSLPENSPRYILYLESNIHPIFFHTLNLHLKYLQKVFSFPESRYPKILALEIVKRKIFWHGENLKLFEKVGVPLDYGDSHLISRILTELKDHYKTEMMERAERSNFHGLYKKLNLDLGEKHYISDSNKMNFMKVIFKLRGQLVYLNNNVGRSEEQRLCTLCNLKVIEDVYHYVGVCPVLQEFRFKYFKKNVLRQDELVGLLNGGDWNALFFYHCNAYKYRTFLVEQYNS